LGRRGETVVPGGLIPKLSIAVFSRKTEIDIFHPFSHDRSSSPLEELGLPAPLAAHMVRAMGGRVDVQETETGTKIGLVLLRAETAQQESS
jgi:K+-sensing histidine kinase KdpD